MKTIFSILFISVFLTVNLAAQNQPQTLQKFTIKDLDGHFFSEKNLANNKYVVFIYFNPTCSHCQRAFKALNENVAKLNNNMAIYGVSVGDKEGTLSFMKKYAPSLNEQSNFMLLAEQDRVFADVYAVQRFPSIYLYSPDKKLLNFDQDEKKVLNFLTKVKPIEQ